VPWVVALILAYYHCTWYGGVWGSTNTGTLLKMKRASAGLDYMRCASRSAGVSKICFLCYRMEFGEECYGRAKLLDNDCSLWW
jgi:hypothetical protein